MLKKLNKYETQHILNVRKVEKMIDRQFYKACQDTAFLTYGLDVRLSDDALFSFADYPYLTRRLNKILDTLKNKTFMTVVSGIKASWGLSKVKNDNLVHSLFGEGVDAARFNRYYSTRTGAVNAFIKRVDNGLSLSDKVWKYTERFKNEIELGIDCGLRDGLSAPEIARSLKMYLQYPDKLFRRVRTQHGILKLSKTAAAFHPGQGVYRSSYKNARRLAATETNIAYRTADFERWQDFDFVVGIEIKLSNNHTLNGKPFTDICDKLKGKYPKDFKFVGWHPLCRCHAIPVLKTTEEMNVDTQKMLNGDTINVESVNKVDKVPDVFTNWVENNKERAKGWSSMPYFVRDNPQYVPDFRVGIYSAAEKKFTRAYHTSPAMKQSLALFLDKKYPDIKNTEKAALIEYTRGDVSDFRHLNKELMQNSLSEFNAAFSELLSSALSKLPTEEVTVYRTIRLNKTNLEAWKQQAVSKAEITFQGFTSTSDDFDVIQAMIDKKAQRIKKNETDVLLVIKGKTGHRISEFSMFPEQREFLFNKGMHLRYDKLSEVNGQIVFHLTEI